MQVTETVAEGLRREYKVVVPAADIEERVVLRLKDVGRKARRPGFRPGKVPMGLLRKLYGASVMGEVLEQTVNDSSQQAITDQGVRPALRPKIEVTQFDEGSDLEFTMALEVLPEVETIDFKALELRRPKAEVTDAVVDDRIERLVKARPRFAPADPPRPAASGDQLLIGFAGKVDGEARPGMQHDGMELVLGSGQFIPGFEDQLIGAEAESHRQVTVTFPDDYQAEDLRSREAVFDVDVKEVRAPGEAAADDELAKAFGMDDLAALRKAIQEQTETEFGRVSRDRAKRALLDALAERYAFDVPAGMVEIEFDGMWRQLQAWRDKAQESGMQDPDLEKPEDELKSEYKGIAERRVRLGLVLSEVGRANNIQVGTDELNRAMLAEARRYPGHEQKMLEIFKENPQAVESVRAPLFEDKVVDFILEIADVRDDVVTPDELLRDPDEPEAADATEAETASDDDAKPAAKRATGKKKTEAAADPAD